MARFRLPPLAVYMTYRLLGAVLVLLGVITAIFLIGELSGQSPALAQLGLFADRASRDRFADENGLNDPLVLRYFRYLGDVAQGDLGVSLATGQPILQLLLRALPITISLALLATIIAIVFSLALGVIAALRRGTIVDRIIVTITSVGQSAPTFWVGILAILWLAVGLRIIPSGGYNDIGDGIGPWLHSLITPAFVLAIPFLSDMTRIIRTSMVEELGKDYVRTATGLGLTRIQVVLTHVLRNAASAPITVLGVKLAALFGGAVLVEAVFRLPGIGSLIVQAVGQADFGVAQGTGIVAALGFVIVNLFVDLAQTWINPRLAKAKA